VRQAAAGGRQSFPSVVRCRFPFFGPCFLVFSITPWWATEHGQLTCGFVQVWRDEQNFSNKSLPGSSFRAKNKHLAFVFSFTFCMFIRRQQRADSQKMPPLHKAVYVTGNPTTTILYILTFGYVDF
jgi:hypothetical protein